MLAHVEDRITIRQAQELTHLSHKTIHRNVQSGKIRGELVSGVWFVNPDDLNKLPKPRKARGIVKSEPVNQVESGSLQGPNFPLPTKLEELKVQLEIEKQKTRRLELVS